MHIPHNLIIFVIFTELCNHHQYLIPEYVITPEETPLPVATMPPFSAVAPVPGDHESPSTDLSISDIADKWTHTVRTAPSSGQSSADPVWMCCVFERWELQVALWGPPCPDSWRFHFSFPHFLSDALGLLGCLHPCPQEAGPSAASSLGWPCGSEPASAPCGSAARPVWVAHTLPRPLLQEPVAVPPALRAHSTHSKHSV